MTVTPAPLSDRALVDLNAALPWFAAAALPDGRILGRLDARRDKRDTVQPIPDKRIVRLHEVLDLSRRSVLEVGCFEGIHTLGLLEFCPDVTAVDVRPLNVVKTLARLSAHGRSSAVYTVDIEDPQVAWSGRFDVVFHCGVLYHLENPVAHLEVVLRACDAIYLDTHVAGGEYDGDEMEHAGRRYVGYRHVEGGWADPFSGRGPCAFWLRVDDIRGIFDAAGFSFELWSERDERNGPRIGVLGRRTGS